MNGGNKTKLLTGGDSMDYMDDKKQIYYLKKAVKSLNKLKEAIPDQKIYIDTHGKYVECKLEDTLIYDTPQGWLAFDAK